MILEIEGTGRDAHHALEIIRLERASVNEQVRPIDLARPTASIGKRGIGICAITGDPQTDLEPRFVGGARSIGVSPPMGVGKTPPASTVAR